MIDRLVLMDFVSFLPMYRVRGASEHADIFWASLRDSMRKTGLMAPERSDDFVPRMKGWLHPRLILGQTCGLPYISKLSDKVELVGTPDYGVDGCPPGFYHSTILVSPGDSRSSLPEFRGATLALNGEDSQSGYAAIMRAVAPYAQDGRFFGRAIHSGSHEASMRLVKEGRVDLASIDSVTWRMSREFDPEITELKVIATTTPTPGLPFISAVGNPTKKIFEAVSEGISSLPDQTRKAFGLKGMLPFKKSDYDMIKTNLAEAERIHSLPQVEELADH
jgi:ABC-type phosphate/phosphonate transport system substrate-binding protein